MIKQTILLLLILLSIKAFAQEVATMNSYIYNDRWTAIKKDTLTIGIASDNGFFSNIYDNSPEKKHRNPLDSSANNQKVIIKNLKRYSWGGERGTVYVIFDWKEHQYYADISNAVLEKEIIIPSNEKKSVQVPGLVRVIRKKIVYRTTYPDFEIEEENEDGNIQYYLEFRNMQYHYATNHTIISLSKDQIKKFADGLMELTKDIYKPGESSVQVAENVLLLKNKNGLSAINYSISKLGYESGDTWVNASQAKSISEAIREYIERND